MNMPLPYLTLGFMTFRSFHRILRGAYLPASIIFMAIVSLGGCSNWSATDSAGKDGEAYTRLVLPSIMRTWDINALDKQVRPEFYETTSRGRMEKMLAFCRRKLGALKTFGIKRSNWNVGMYSGTGAVLDEAYEVDATFQKAKGVIKLSLRKQDDVWKIRGLNIDSDAFLN